MSAVLCATAYDSTDANRKSCQQPSEECEEWPQSPPLPTDRRRKMTKSKLQEIQSMAFENIREDVDDDEFLCSSRESHFYLNRELKEIEGLLRNLNSVSADTDTDGCDVVAEPIDAGENSNRKAGTFSTSNKLNVAKQMRAATAAARHVVRGYNLMLKFYSYFR